MMKALLNAGFGVIGLYTRYYFFKVIGFPKKLDQLAGKIGNEPLAHKFCNYIIGLLIILGILLLFLNF